MIENIDNISNEMLTSNRKKMGFTLVELLAVFVVLAIIAGIALFSISKIKETVTLSAYEESIKNVLTAAQNYYSANAQTAFPQAGLSILDDRLEIENRSEYTGGVVKYNSITGKLEAQNITNSEYCANGPIDNLVIIEGNCQ